MKNWDNGPFSHCLFWKTLSTLHSDVHSKSIINSCVTNEKYKTWLIPHLCPAGQPWCEVDVNVGLSVLESYTLNLTLKRCGGGFQSYLTIGQAALMERRKGKKSVGPYF